MPVATPAIEAVYEKVLAAGAHPDVDVVGYPGTDWLVFLALAAGPMMIGHTGVNYALRYMPAYVANLALLGEPIGATLLAWWLPGIREAPTPQLLLGGLLGGGEPDPAEMRHFILVRPLAEVPHAFAEARSTRRLALRAIDAAIDEAMAPLGDRATVRLTGAPVLAQTELVVTYTLNPRLKD